MSEPGVRTAPILIVGAGLAGLACAYHLKSPYQLWEKEEEVGGLARSRLVKGFSFDLTGHWLHLRLPAMRQFITETLGLPMVEVARRAVIQSGGVRTPYPFQAHTHGRPIPVVAECLLGYFAARERRSQGHAGPPTSFADHIREQLGEGIAKHFMIPYNTKLWTVSPEELSARWCKRFVPQPEPEEVVLGALRPEGVGHAIGYNATFYYPESGGIGSLPRKLHGALPTAALVGMELGAVDYKNRIAVTVGGQRLPYRALVSSLPLPDLMARLTQVPEQLREASAHLRSASVTYWNLAFKGADHHDSAHWVYFPEERFPFYRIGSPSAVLPYLAPLQHRSYWVEVSHRNGTSVTVTDAQVLDALQQAGVIAPGEEPVLIERHTIRTAYAILDHHAERVRDDILSWLQERGIFSTGRYGGWVYHGMEDSLLAGEQTAHHVEEYCEHHA